MTGVGASRALPLTDAGLDVVVLRCSAAWAEKSPPDQQRRQDGEDKSADPDGLLELRRLRGAPVRRGDGAGEERGENGSGHGDADAGGNLGSGVDQRGPDR